ncbi:ATP-binding cassette domain-containing protein [Nesterenkonia pannonica]|uniref:ABC transporter ATP-binding protein n=1 Tax=Nesterenkonia pannonica TaxID=1548602 RepID=UPI002164BD74|nr:ATP-binding cassette domain-containing protein [Nesterenkonia pannonica]
MLNVTDLVAGYRDATVIHGLNLHLRAYEMTAVLGRNGVGKSTLLKSIFGLCRITSGDVMAEDQWVRPGRPELLARRGFSFMPDDRGVFSTLTVEENLRLARRKDYTPPVDVTELFPLLNERASQQAGSLSGGQKQQVGIARAILQGSRMVVIDEFSQGLQPSISRAALLAFRQLCETGVSVVIVEQSPALPLEHCDRIVGMSKGQVVLDRTVAEVEAEPSELNDLLIVT